jgi:hypothetical protein
LAAVVDVEEVDIVAVSAVAVKAVEVDEEELQGERRRELQLAGRSSWARRSLRRRPRLLLPQSMDCIEELLVAYC